jgi:hypothetical protein
MSKDIAAEIEKQYGNIDFSYPRIYFGYNSIELRGILSELEEVYFVIPIALIWIPMFVMPRSVSTILFIFIYIVMYIYYCYEKIFVLDIIKIDFLNKEIFISNRFRVINFLRKIFRRPITISFQEIIEFKNYKRAAGRFVSRGNVLVVKTYDHSPIKIAQFRFESESEQLVQLLNQYIVGKATFID